jgi:hypothetical protein
MIAKRYYLLGKIGGGSDDGEDGSCEFDDTGSVVLPLC